MKEAKTTSKNELPPGTLEMLILKMLSIEPMHGYGIAQHIQMLSADVLTIEEGSLYPALRRMLAKRWVLAEWKMSANNRRARFYTLTTVGRRPLDVEASRFSQMFAAIKRVMKTTKCPDSQEGVVGAVLRRDLEGELRVHEERKARALADADGMNDDEARAVARRRMGNSLRLFEQSRNHGASRC